MTARRALSLLAEEGLVERRIGRGTFVAEHPPVQPHLDTDRRTIAVAVPCSQLADPETAYAIAGVRQVLPQDDFVIDVLESDESGCTLEFVDMLVERGVQGFVCASFIRPAAAARLREKGIPFVKAGLPPKDPGVPCVALDMEHLLDQMVREAYRFGHQELGLVWWQSSARPAPVTPAQYAKTCRRFGLVSSAPRVVELPGLERMDPTCVDTSPVLALNPMPTALITTDECVAGALMRDLEAHGYRVPQHVSLMSLLAHTPHAHPVPLTAPNTAADRPKQFRLAAKLLLRLMEGPPPSELLWHYQERLHLAASLAPAPTQS